MKWKNDFLLSKVPLHIFTLLLGVLASILLGLICYWSGIYPFLGSNDPVDSQESMVFDRLEIAQLQNSNHWIQTLDIIDHINVSYADVLHLNLQQKQMESLPMVSYKSNSPFIEDIPFVGRPHSKYKIRYLITPKFLKIYKVAPAGNISIQERPSARLRHDGQLEVLMLGVPIVNFYKNNEVIQDPRKRFMADSIQIERNNSVIFQAMAKKDVFPQNLLQGEWFYAATIISAPAKEDIQIGGDVTADFKYENVSRVKFIRQSNYLTAVNLNVDKNINTREQTNYQSAIKIPVHWLDFQTNPLDASFGFIEQALDDEHLLARKWSKRSYMQLNWGLVETPIMETGNNILKELDIFDDYISFVLLNQKLNVKIRFSLKRATPIKKGRIYFQSDRSQFGFFSSTKDYLQTYKFHRQKDHEKQVLINHFMPDHHQIVYHFTHTSPAHWRPAGRQVVAAWNKAFTLAQTGISVVLDESFDVSLGDLRYNAINLFDTLDNSKGLGFGPTVVDAQSGEIISATSNIYINPLREYLVKGIRTYILHRIGLLGQNYIGELLPITQSQESPFEKTHRQLMSKIQQLCPQIESHIQGLIQLRQKSADDTLTGTEEEVPILEKCTQALLPDKIVETLVHEMGHNFGLRHNFMASADRENYSAENVPFSSVMDYTAGQVYGPIDPGKYDIASLRFAYAKNVETKDGRILPLNPQQSLQEQFKNPQTIRSYKYCTDEDIGEQDPLCERWDYGANAAQVASFLIDSFNVDYALNYFRYDRAVGPDINILSNINDYFTYQKLKNIYNHWRYFLAKYIKLENRYLSNFSSGDLLKVVQKMQRDPEHGSEYRSYAQAAHMSYSFFKTLAFLPPHYCLLNKSKNKNKNKNKNDLGPREFTELYEEQKQNHARFIKSCQEYDPTTKDKILAQGQHSGNVVNFQQHTPMVEIAGLSLDREKAFDYLIQRDLALQLHRIDAFKGQWEGDKEQQGPNFLDEPQYRQELYTLLQERILQGISRQDLGVPKSVALVEGYWPIFQSEKVLLSKFYNKYRWGLLIPGDKVHSEEREERFALKPIYLKSQLDKSLQDHETQTYTYFNGHYLTAHTDNSFVYALIEKRKQLLQMEEQLPQLAQYKKRLLQARSLHVSLLQNRTPARAESTGPHKEMSNIAANEKNLQTKINSLQHYLKHHHEFVAQMDLILSILDSP